MFNSRIIDNSSNCNIIKSSLVDDLLNYDIVENQDFLNLQFKDGSTSYSSIITSNLNNLAELVDNTNLLEVWQPLFVINDNFVKTKMLSNYGSYKNSNKELISGRIGIEDFFTFTPHFRHWEVDNGVMSVDWILNKANCPYHVNYGIMGWYKIKDSSNSRSYGGALQSIDKFPNSSRLKHSSKPDNIYIKIDDNLLYDITNIASSIDQKGTWTFNDESKTTLVEVSSFGENPQFSLSDIYYETDPTDSTKALAKYKIINPLLGPNSHLWIPDGDFFSYFYSEEDKVLSLNANISSNSYVSASLYNNYSNIYRIITLDEVRSFDKKDLRKARAYKKLAHALSTSPFITDFNIYALDYIEIRKIIQQYIQNQKQIVSISVELDILKNTLRSISTILQNTIVSNTKDNSTNRGLFLDTKSLFTNFNNNLITNQAQLFKKLINKYGAQLKITTTTTISPKNLKYNNDGIAISQILDSYANKDVGGTLYNSQQILFDQTTISIVTDPSKTNECIITNGTDITKVPLVDWAKPTYGIESKINIELAYNGNVLGMYRNNGITFNTIGSPQTYIFQSDLEINDKGFAEIAIELSCLNIIPNIRSKNEPGQFDIITFLQSNIIVEWEQISGPSGTFKKINGVAGLSPDTTFYANSTGKFIVQCTVSTPFGTYKKRKTFYVVDGREIFPPDPRSQNPRSYPNMNYGKYLDKPDTWINPPDRNPNKIEETPIILNTDKLITQTTKINSIAINNMAGVVWPIKTNLSVREHTGPLSNAITENIFELSGDYKFTYSTNYSSRLNNPNLKLIFIPNNTIIKIHSIYLEKIRSNETGCENCLSFYEPKIISRNNVFYTAGVDYQANIPNNISRYYRVNKFPEGFTFIKYKPDPNSNSMIFDNYVGFTYPKISTKYSPKIKSYGGYSKKFITDTTSLIPEHPLPNDNVKNSVISNNSSILSYIPINGYKIDYKNDKKSDWLKICYQKPLIGVPPDGSIIKFNKGVFIPNSGWIPYDKQDYQIHANRCGLLKFNPGARDSFSFIGPSLSKIKNSDIDITNNIVNNKIFSSSISLALAPEIRWDPDCSCGSDPVTKEDPDAYQTGTQRQNDNQTHKEYIDIDPNISNHGYRILAGGAPKQSERTALRNSSFVNDEFLTDHNTDNNTISYSFAVTGPALLPVMKTQDGGIMLRNPRVNNFGIKDIEVKLNFLNYVNTKNLVVWLEVDYDTDERNLRYPPDAKQPSSPLRSNKEFIDQSFSPNLFSISGVSDSLSSLKNINNSEVYNYLNSLTDMNSKSTKNDTSLKLYLLNQENITHNQFNFSVKFSDNSSKYNTIYDTNTLSSVTGLLNSNPVSPKILSDMLSNRESIIKNNQNSNPIAIYQNIINNNDTISPTVAATGFTDRECCINGSIIKHNRLNISNNTFSKFVAQSLFRGAMPTSGPCGTEQAPKQRGADFNGETRFTLKMMVLDETDDMNPCDNIDYQYKNGLDSVDNKLTSTTLTNSLCNWELILHVGPVHKPVPYTSPNISSYGSSDVLSLIDYDKNPNYPGYSFIADLTNYKHLLPIANLNAPYSCVADSTTCISDSKLVVGGGSLGFRPPEFPNYAAASVVASLGTFGSNYGFSVLLNWLSELRFFQKLEDLGQQLYMPIYDEYSFGSSEKMLILFRKPGSLWYNAEATIMKYHNTPILKPNKYKFIKVQRGNGKYISEFKYTIVNNYNELIDSNIIKSIDCTCNDWNSLKTSIAPYQYNNVLIDKGDLINVNLTSSDCSEENGLYITTIDGWTKITEDNLDKISQAIHFVSQNVVLCGGKPFFDSDLKFNLQNNKVIICETRIPYDLFSVNDKIECYDQNESSLAIPPSLVTATIINKALLFKNNKYYSIFSLDSNVSSGDVISARNSDSIFFVFNNRTSIEDKIVKKYNLWGLDQNKILSEGRYTQVMPNTHSVGSYGDLSLFLDKNVLSNNIQHNKLETYHSIFNNKINDKIKYNKITIYNKDNVEQTIFKNKSCYGFAYSEKDLNPKIFDTKDFCYYITPEYLRPDGDSLSIFENLKKEIKLSTSTENEIPYRYGYIKASVDSINILPPTVLYGELTIENDFVEHIPIRIISSDEITQLQTRLLLIDDKNFTDVDNSIGVEDQTSTVLQSSNLSSILKHYNSLPDDPAACHRPNKPSNCYKQQTIQKINDLYLERKEIIDLLEYQTIRCISLWYVDDNNENKQIEGEIIYENDKYITIKSLSDNTQTKIVKNTIILDDSKHPTTRSFKSKSILPKTDPRYLNPDILPKISPTIQVDPITQTIIIKYDKINSDHYWINIDPKQSTFKDFEKNPRILVKTTYICIPVNPLQDNKSIIKNNICPNLKSDETPKGSSIDTTIKQDGAYTSIYVINSDSIENQKDVLNQSFPAIKGWRTFTKIRYFNINGDQTLDTVPASETIVRAEEEYLIPLTKEDMDSPELDIKGGDGSADTQILLRGIPICPAGTNLGSIGGKGLWTSYGRVGKPTRVYNIVNLDNINTIDVMIKRIPRLLRGVDLLATIHRYGFKNLYRQNNPTNPLTPTEIDLTGSNGSINNSLYYWTCYQKNPDSGLLEQTTLPDFFKLQNEMIFRAFFGSVDKIENRTNTTKSYFPWELIPYEYDRTTE